MPNKTADSVNRPRQSLLAHLVRTVSWPHWTAHRLRTALTVIGISLGVATVVGMANVSRSILTSFRHMVQTVAGSAELEITSPAGDVQEGLGDLVAKAPGVRAAGGIIEQFVTLADRPEESLYLLGLDFLGSPFWEGQLPQDALDIPDETEFVILSDSVVLTRTFMERVGLSFGDPIRVLAPDGVRTLRVRGVLADAPITSLFDGMVAVMDLPAAQKLVARDRRVDRVVIQVEPGENVSEVRAHLAQRLGSRVDVAPTEARGQESERLLFSLRSMLICASSLAVIVGAFIVYTTVAVSVQQRRRQFALLNTIGVRRRSLVHLCLAETLVLATLGMILGVVAGEVFGRLAGGVAGDAASEIWLPLRVDHRARSVPGLLAGAGIGVSTALVAAYVAIRATFRSPTVAALRPASVELEPPGRFGRLLGIGLALATTSWLIVLVPPGLGFGTLVGIIIATHVVVYAGGAVLAPSLVLGGGRIWRWLTRRSTSLSLRLAADNLPRSPSRSGSTVATIAAALGMAVTLAGVVHSFESAWLGWVEQHFGADLFVGSGARFRLLAGPPMAEEVGHRIAGVPGVAAVEPFRVLRIRLGEQPVFLQGIALEERAAHGGLPMVQGDFEAALPALRSGRGALISDNLAMRSGLQAGDTLTIPTPSGPRRFRIEGTYVDYVGSLDLGAVALARTQVVSLWQDRQANLYRVWLTPDASPSGARQRVLAELGGHGYYVITAGQFLESVRTVLNRFFLATWALQFVAAIVGVIGVVNAQLATVLDRSREIAMIRTVGVPARHIVRSVILECSALGAIGGLGGLVFGTMLGAQFILVALVLITGWRMPFTAPVVPVVTSVLIAICVSAIAGYVPARAAARLSARQQSLD
jgi:putative ABC transport system permease protein